MNIHAALAALRIVHARLVAPYAPKPRPPSLETPITAATLAEILKGKPCTIH